MPVKASMKGRGVAALQSIMARLETDDTDPDVKDLAEVLENFRPGMLPPVLSGWLLLQRSGLTAQERATVLASAKNSLDVTAIETALRDQWADAELRERDALAKRNLAKRAFLGQEEEEPGEQEESDEEDEDDPEDEANFGSEDDDTLDVEGLTGSEKEAAEQALAMIRDTKAGQSSARRTLAQARAVVKDIKTNRGYYKPGAKAKGKGPGPCFSCGGPHLAKDCSKNKDKKSDKDKDKKKKPDKNKDKKTGAGFMAFSFAGFGDHAADNDDDPVDLDYAFSGDAGSPAGRDPRKARPGLRCDP